MKLDNLGEALVSSAVFAGIGLVVFGVAFWLMDKLAPFSIAQGDRGGPQHRAGDHHGRRDHRHRAHHRRRPIARLT